MGRGDSPLFFGDHNMKIESIIRREGGTNVTLGGTLYRFLPDDIGRHVTDVTDEDHISKFLAVREGFRLLAEDQEPDAPVPPVIDPGPAKTLEPAAVLEPDEGEVENQAEDEEVESGEKATDVAAETEPTAEHDPYAQKGGPDGDRNTLDREEVARAFEERYGRRPHGRWTAERILEELQQQPR